MKDVTNVVDEKIWAQAKKITTGLQKKPSSLPHRIGAMSGLEEDDDEVTIITLVDGDWVKLKYDMDFAEGANEEEETEYCEGIWVNANLPIKEWAFVIYHEAVEYKAMCQDEMSAEVAHQKATKGERELRMSAWRDQGRSL